MDLGKELQEPRLYDAIYRWSRGDRSDCFSTIEHYAINGHPEAQEIIGTAYAVGFSPADKDRAKAIYWLEKATENGHFLAPIELAFLYDPSNILTDPKDVSAELAAEYFYLGFEYTRYEVAKGNVVAMVTLANCYGCGWGTEVDVEKARYWQKKAIASGYRGQL